MRRLNELGKGRKVIENSVMRDLSYSAARRLEPVVAAGIRRSPAPQAGAVAATVRAKRDRMIVVRAGATNPRLSGFKRSGMNSVWRGSVAWGVAVGPGPRRGRVSGASVKRHRVNAYRRRGVPVRRTMRAAHQRAGGTRAAANVYRVGRTGGPPDPFTGYLSGVRTQVIDQARREYADIVLQVVRRNGWPIDPASRVVVS